MSDREVDALDRYIRGVVGQTIDRNYPEYKGLIEKLRNNPSAQDIQDMGDWIDNSLTGDAIQKAHDLLDNVAKQ